jgi:3-oxoacyl-[acyl-carrier protein] reductase
MDLELRGKNAIVTGASKGIGLAIAHALAAEGVNLMIAARSEEKLEQAALDLTERYRIKVSVAAVDLATEAGLEQLLGVVRERLMPVDIIVNNAGAIPGGSLQSLAEEVWRQAYELKLWGYIRLTRAVLPTMYERRTGVVLNIIGNAGAQPSPAYIAGGIANAGLMNFTRALAREAGPHGVRVVAINPGPIRTDRIRALTARIAQERGLPIEEGEAALLSEIPLGRIGEPEEIASVATFLVSPRANFITGVTIPVEGGGTRGL